MDDVLSEHFLSVHICYKRKARDYHPRVLKHLVGNPPQFICTTEECPEGVSLLPALVENEKWVCARVTEG